jgi:hypothetical protein
LVYAAHRDSERVKTLKASAVNCVQAGTPNCDGLADNGVAVDLFLQNASYQTAIKNKVLDVNDKPRKQIKALDVFTHQYAAEHGISLPDSYTSHWSKPESD